MIFTHIPLGLLNVNTYILADEDSQEGFIIDVGGDFDILHRQIQNMGILVQKILLTHGHLDHVHASNEARNILQAPVYIHESDKELYKDSKIRSLYGQEAIKHLDIDFLLQDDDLLTFGRHQIKVIHTPGHTQGSVCFLVDDNFLISGDTLFRESIGRTDHMGGNKQQEIISIKEKLMPLADVTEVFPGHGPSTTIGYERQYNRYLQ